MKLLEKQAQEAQARRKAREEREEKRKKELEERERKYEEWLEERARKQYGVGQTWLEFVPEKERKENPMTSLNAYKKAIGRATNKAYASIHSIFLSIIKNPKHEETRKLVKNQRWIVERFFYRDYKRFLFALGVNHEFVNQFNKEHFGKKKSTKKREEMEKMLEEFEKNGVLARELNEYASFLEGERH